MLDQNPAASRLEHLGLSHMCSLAGLPRIYSKKEVRLVCVCVCYKQSTVQGQGAEEALGAAPGPWV